MKKFIFFIVCCIVYNSFGQKKYPQNYFRNPLDIPMVLAGTFGELRSNHFHSGIDIKTQGVEGKKVYTVQKGYVSRIKVSLWGYGKAIYISHPNGYTSVYGHLKKFSPRIEAYIRKKQYEKKSFEIQLFPNADELVLSENEMIAYSGNTGGSSGPHLHFELRDTGTEKIINPLLFGYQVKDNISPTLLELKGFPIDNDSYINSINASHLIKTRVIGKNTFATDTLKAHGNISFGVQTHDLLNGAPNKNGIYNIYMYVDDQLHYQYTMDTYAFSEKRYINLHFDYGYYYKFRKKFQKTFVEDANHLSVYRNLINKGVINVTENDALDVKIVIEDFAKNKTTIKIPVKGTHKGYPVFKTNPRTDYLVPTNEFKTFKKGLSEVRFPKNTFYKDTYVDYQYFDDHIKMHKSDIPVKKSYTLTYFTDSIPKSKLPYLYFGRKSSNGKYYNYQTTHKAKGKIYTSTTRLGNFYLRYDSIKPVIYKPDFHNGQDISKYKTLVIHIKDLHTGIKSYYGTIDGEWVLMEYNTKKRQLTYDFKDKALSKGKHIFELKIKDLLGNTAYFKSSFIR